MIPITRRADGLVLPVRAQPGARKAAVVGEHGGALKVAVTAPAEGGGANEALREVLCAALGLKRAQIELLSGQRSRDKHFLVRGLTSEELHLRVSRLATT